MVPLSSLAAVAVGHPVGDPRFEHPKKNKRAERTSLRDRKQTISYYMPFFAAYEGEELFNARTHRTIIKNQFLACPVAPARAERISFETA